ncbi:hypothetical protein KKF34_11700 [Myxococcota bacterium]|nr:hypothetical protein [Myxococcota bacterium]MBU1382700.1 hypothetical protein [Myxococcota bacterium]MBU1497528.1 hypothetical protein [Myxococcota bacterium]
MSAEKGKLNIYLDSKETPDVFHPMSLPGAVRADLKSLSAADIIGGSIQLTAGLAKGIYEFYITENTPFMVEISESTSINLSIDAAQVTEGNDSFSVLKDLRIDFSKPLILRNVMQTLNALPSLFSDNDIVVIKEFFKEANIQEITKNITETTKNIADKISSTLKSTGMDTGFFSKSSSFLGKAISSASETIKNTIDQSKNLIPFVHLEKARARPTKNRAGDWILEFSFTGKVVHGTRILHNFDDFILPHAVIPSVWAKLEKLISPQPLSSASLLGNTPDAFRLLKEFARCMEDWAGSFTISGTMPTAALDMVFHDKAEASIRLDSPLPLQITGNISGSNSKKALKITTSGLKISSGQSSLSVLLTILFESKHDDYAAVFALIDAVENNKQINENIEITVTVDIPEGSELFDLEMSMSYRHPLVRGGADFSSKLLHNTLSGNMVLKSRPGTSSLITDKGDFNFKSDYMIRAGEESSDGITMLKPEIGPASVAGTISLLENDISFNLDTSSPFRIVTNTQVLDLAELNISEGFLNSEIQGTLNANIMGKTTVNGDLTVSDFSGSHADFMLSELELSLEEKSLVFPPTHIEVGVNEAYIDSTGLGRSSFNLKWDLNGESPELIAPGTDIEIFVDELRQGNIIVKISESGGLEVSGLRGGLYDAAFFNFLVNPTQEPEKLIEILKSDDSWEKISRSIAFFNPDFAKTAEKLRTLARKGIAILEKYNITKPAHMLPAEVLSRVFSEVLSGDLTHEKALYDIIMKVVNAQGLDTSALKRILDSTGEFEEYQFELHRLVKWLSLVLSPVKVDHPRARYRAVPLSKDSSYADVTQGLPAAESIYDFLENPEVSLKMSREIAKTAHYLDLHVLEYLIDNGLDAFNQADYKHLLYIRDFKKRVNEVSENFGGITHLPQAWSMSFFLSAACGNLPAHFHNANRHIGKTVSSPIETALLLRSTLSDPLCGRTVQINFATILRMMVNQGSFYTKQVLGEMCDGSPRVLAFMLFGLCNFKQNLLREEINTATILSEHLGVTIPRINDYMAGGRFARISYIEELFRVSEQIMDQFNSWYALRSHLNVYRAPILKTISENQTDDLPGNIDQLIKKAETITAKCTFSSREKKRQEEAKAAWDEVFRGVSELIKNDPSVCVTPWFKSLWGRSYEALIVAAIVNNWKQDIDNVRKWVSVRTGKTPVDANEILDTCIDAIYFNEEDRKQLKSDPFVRLCVSAPEGKYDFTIVSCMGVVTEGAKGRELEDAYRRLFETYGIRVLRADTKTARNLYFNAWQILKSLDDVDGPFGFIGYSQGCANALRAESLLAGGTPPMRAKLERLKSRNLLFSAINGSTHGSCGNIKFMNALSEMDKILKYYQAVFSGRAVKFFLSNLNALLDSRSFVHLLGGMESLSHSGVTELAREGQFKRYCPTAIMRGIVEPDNTPEALDFLSNTLTAQIQSQKHDTQVQVDEACGHFLYVENEANDILEENDMSALIQRCHHWSPLIYATEFITTKRDTLQAIYDMPKDRHVFPWVENLARFGIISVEN